MTPYRHNAPPATSAELPTRLSRLKRIARMFWSFATIMALVGLVLALVTWNPWVAFGNAVQCCVYRWMDSGGILEHAGS